MKENWIKFYICSMLVFSIVNCAIDLRNKIISNIRAETKQSYKNIFEILKKNKIINEKDKNDLIYLVRIR
ncbi:MAG: HepT-like ribonuclease domain-containing protein [Candidatus Aenigmatarchaeota archaeon]